jgi:hypothetical protein
LGEYSIAATKIEDALAGMRLEQIEHGLAERRHEICVYRIGVWIPRL